MASRHLSRSLVLQSLFESDMIHKLTLDHARAVLARNITEFSLGDSDRTFAESLLTNILVKRSEIDAVIEKAAPQWPIDKIAPVDRNVLRIGLYELLFGDRTSVPPKVALNEAIEIAKSYGGDASGKFVNGVLGAVYREIGEPQKNEIRGEVAKEERLGGAVVVATEGKAQSVALVHDVFHHWTLPKTRCRDDEVSRTAAERAVKDELGITATAGEPIGEHSYMAHDPETGPTKRTVAYYVAEVAGSLEVKCTVCDGIDDARWFAASELDKLPIYEDLRGIIEAALQKAKKV